MRNFRQIVLVTTLLVGSVAFAGAAEKSPGADSEIVAGSWQHHTMNIHYFGITTLFSCSGLEDHVKAILVHFGARKDAKVSAYGCSGPDHPSRIAVVDVDFHSLAPVSDGAGSNSVQAYWSNRELQPDRPFFMDAGDCELVHEMKDVISKSFTLKDLKYDTDCFPHQINMNGYHVEATALMAVPALKANEPKRR
jgi:hypothetical protein